MNKFTKYIRATIAEIRQVAWPSQRQATLYTILVVIIATIVAIYIGAFDYIYSQGINFLVNKF